MSSVTVAPSSVLSPESMASLLGSGINSSSAVIGPCPALEPVQVFSDFLGTRGSSVDYSIGVDLELLTFQWGSGAPTFSVSNSGGGTMLALVGVSSTPMPADAMYSGAPATKAGLAPPSDVTGDQVAAFGAANGAGLHLQGAAAALFTRGKFGNVILPNLYGVQIDTSGVTYSDTQIQGNDLTGNSMAAALFQPALAAYAGLTLSSNAGFNPTGMESAPAMTCAHSVTNPFPVAQQVYIQGAFMGVNKDGTNILGAGSSAVVQLGVGESLRINCSSGSLPQVHWYGV